MKINNGHYIQRALVDQIEVLVKEIKTRTLEIK